MTANCVLVYFARINSIALYNVQPPFNCIKTPSNGLYIKVMKIIFMANSFCLNVILFVSLSETEKALRASVHSFFLLHSFIHSFIQRSPVQTKVLVSWATFPLAILLIRRWFFHVYFSSALLRVFHHLGNQPPEDARLFIAQVDVYISRKFFFAFFPFSPEKKILCKHTYSTNGW